MRCGNFILMCGLPGGSDHFCWREENRVRLLMWMIFCCVFINNIFYKICFWYIVPSLKMNHVPSREIDLVSMINPSTPNGMLNFYFFLVLFDLKKKIKNEPITGRYVSVESANSGNNIRLLRLFKRSTSIFFLS